MLPAARLFPQTIFKPNNYLAMSNELSGFINPFGEVCCEDEIQLLNDQFKEYYFDHVPFNQYTLENSTYLIIGRRGSGKTSLSHYFSFHNNRSLQNSICIDVDEPKLYQQVLKKIARQASNNTDIAIPRIVKIWEYIIWTLIFKEYREHSPVIASASFFDEEKSSPGKMIYEILKKILAKFLKDDNSELTDDLEALLSDETIVKAKEEVCKITQKKPVIVAIDTLENYDINDDAMMRATAALIECASNYNIRYLRFGIHIKIFVSAEVFPHLIENVISNTNKFVRNPVYLNWRPRDLIRLLCWRFCLYLEHNKFEHKLSTDKIDWSRFDDVYNKIWTHFFTERIKNGIGLIEKSFPYILRHSQMRPRQLIILCNTISNLAKRNEVFPYFSSEIIVSGVRETEIQLATEVINSYKSVYPNVGLIVDALVSKPIMFKGKLLDKIAPETASAWPNKDYSPLRFRQLISELGIIGRVKNYDKQTGIVQADFEYTMKSRLAIQSSDDCVIHPMFLKRLNTLNEEKIKVYPFPDGEAYNEIFS